MDSFGRDFPRAKARSNLGRNRRRNRVVPKSTVVKVVAGKLGLQMGSPCRGYRDR